MQRRYVEDLDIFEVSIIDNTKTPAYIATSIEQRDNKEVVTENRFNDFKAITIDETTEKINVGKEEREVIDYSLYEKEIELLKLKA